MFSDSELNLDEYVRHNLLFQYLLLNLPTGSCGILSIIVITAFQYNILFFGQFY